MPKDKTETHKRVVEAARAEFLEKGYERASMRSIGARAGITSAGLYRHFPDKESMFSALVEDSVRAVDEWIEQHVSLNISAVEEGAFDHVGLFVYQKDANGSSGQTQAVSLAAEDGLPHDTSLDLFRYVIYPRHEDFRLILVCGKGTRYENYIDNMVREQQPSMVKAFDLLRAHGVPVRTISDDELHIMLSANMTALFEPIVHGYDEKEFDHYLQTIGDFFMPGWLRIMGLERGQ